MDRIVGIVGGIIGGLLFNGQWPVDQAGEQVWLAIIASGVAALVGSFILLDLYHGFVRRSAGETTGGG